MTITKQQVIEYIESLGSTAEDLSYSSLDTLRDEIKAGDAYDGGTIWQDILDHYNATDITDDN